MPEPDDELRRELRSLAHEAAIASSGPRPAEVRARGARRRRRRVTAVATVVTLAVVGIGTVAFGAARDVAGNGPVGPAGGDTGLSADDLPTADELPGFNDKTGWRTVLTLDNEGSSGVSCQRQHLADLGAVSVWRREFRATRGVGPGAEPDLGNGASTVVLNTEFADDEAAWQAADTLRSWVEDCDRASSGETDVTEIGDIAVAGGEGTAWLVSSTFDGNPDFGLLTGTAVGLSGDRVVLVSQTRYGMDYDYTGRTPIEAALAAALDRLPPG